MLPGSPVRPPRLRSPLARAVVPVLGGMAVIGLIFVVTWLVALPGRRGRRHSRRETIFMGSVENRAESIAEDGPDRARRGLNTDTGKHTIVVDHTGDDPAEGWKVFWAYPGDRDETCLVEQVRETARFVDCDGRTIDVTELAGAEGVSPVVADRETLTIDLREALRRQADGELTAAMRLRLASAD